MGLDSGTEAECDLRISSDLFSHSNLVSSHEDLAFVCACASSVDGSDREPESEEFQPYVTASQPSQPMFRSALECMLDKSTLSAGDNLNNISTCLFSDILRGAGIAEISGSSGSGKTSFCLSFVNSASGVTLYVDTSGSVCLSRVFDTSRFLYLRVFNSEELDLVVSDFAHRLSEDSYLPCFSDLRAQSVTTLVIDSLWPLCFLDPLQLRKYLIGLYSTLREISWRHCIGVLVCNNESTADARPSDSDKSMNAGSLTEQLRSRCYLHISLEQHVCSDKSDGSTLGESCSGGASLLLDGVSTSDRVVRRVMNITNGSDSTSRSVDFCITKYGIASYA
ncbi:uncharacterized protein BXIN_3099 [Babesia sp. Xinjiang]|uniref:uncharacterized protein n=1 Tax=Babesia sp. Xinjiang TaxID=462227 RepID=UPI000A21F46B|nr:uncharacterized protein BXIN_3099 [Babesia sp. Xinjiang]ORM39523.1 hypothetical protein BXIN_3099 [Babesia sp. Xinjiang]